MTTNKFPVFNPITGRNLAPGSPAYKKLMAQLLFDDVNGVLIPRDKTDFYLIVPENIYVKKNTPQANNRLRTHNPDPNNTALYSKQITVDWNDRFLSIYGTAFNKLMAQGYRFDLKSKKILPPYELMPLRFPSINRIDDPAIESVINSVMNKPNLLGVEFLRRGNSVDGMTAPFRKKDFIGKLLSLYFHTYDPSDSLTHTINVWHGNRPNFNIGPAFTGTKNCVIQKIEEHFKTNGYPFDHSLYDTYAEGVFEDDYETLSKNTRMPIVVYYANATKKLVFGARRKKRAGIKLYYDDNHVARSYESIDGAKETIYVKELPTSLNEPIINMVGSSYDLRIIITPTKKYALQRIDGFDMEKYDTCSAAGYYAGEFLEANPKLVPVPPNDKNIEAIKTMCQHGIFHDNGNPATYKYDIISAYNSYEKCEYYSGIPTDLTTCLKLDNWKFDKKLDVVKNYEGAMLVNMMCMFTKKMVTRWVSMPYVRYYIQERKNESIELLECILSMSKVDLVNTALKYGKRAFPIVLGKLNKTKKYNNHITTDAIMAASIGVRDNIDFDGVTYYKYSEIIEKTNGKYYPHVSMYVQSYTEIRVEQFIREVLDDSFTRVWVDGINSNVDVADAVCEAYGFRKELPYCIDYHCDVTYKATQLLVCSETPKFCKILHEPHDNRVLLCGGPGCGKSYNFKLLNRQMPNSCILVQNYELAKDYYGYTVKVFENYMQKHQYVYPVVMIDEYCLINQEQLDRLIATGSVRVIILGGDVEQLKPYKGELIDTTNYTKHELTINYRTTDPEFQAKLNQARANGLFAFKNQTTVEEALRRKMLIVSSTHKAIDKINTIGQSLNPNNAIDGFKVGDPVRFYKKHEDMTCGTVGRVVDIRDGMLYIEHSMPTVNGAVEAVINSIPIKTFVYDKNKLAYAITYHTVQGKTIEGYLALDTWHMFDKAMKYVGVSRVRSEDQLYRLSDTKKLYDDDEE